VGPQGRVFAQDLSPGVLERVRQRTRAANFTNVRFVQGSQANARLPAASVDVALMIHMYHEIEQPFGVLYNLATAFKPGGRLVILDLERPTFGHGTPPSLLRCELRAVGYRERRFTRTTSEEYVAVFDAPVLAQRPTPEAITAALTRSPCRAP